MKKLYSFLLLLPLVVFAQNEPNIVPGELLLQLNHGVELNDVLNEVNKDVHNPDLELVQTISKRLNTWRLSFNENNITNLDVMNLFATRKDVSIVQFNHNNIVNRDTLCPDDTRFNEQWSYYNNGANGSGGTADMMACDAWAITTGGFTVQNDRIVVAVIDGGFDINHEDVNFYVNPIEAAGTTGIDDDGNGYVDDINGWGAASNNGTIPSAQHGTHVSGTVGAIGNNNLGVTGVNWDVDVMSIATTGSGGGGLESTVLVAYGYALEMRALYDQTNGTKGAFVVATNSSFGVDDADPNDYPLWCNFYDSLGAYGILSAGATANQNTNVDVDGDVPTACSSDWMISVTNTTSYDVKTQFAGYGLTTIDLGAPGTDILSTNPSNDYGTSSGTSMATPQVAGTIGLMWSAACDDMITDYKANPQAMALTVRNYLLNDGVDFLSSLDGITVTGGRLNLHKSVLAMDQYGACADVGLSEEFVGHVQLYPNPTKGELNIDYKGLDAGVYNLSIVNLLGQVNYNEQISLLVTGKQTIDLTSIQAGVYLVNVVNAKDGAKKSFQLVIE